MALSSTWMPLPDEVTRGQYFWGVARGGHGGSPSELLPGDLAAAFLGRSGLPRDTLTTIWTLADASNRGALDFKEFMVALRLISMAQVGADVSGAAFLAMARVPLPPPQLSISGISGTGMGIGGSSMGISGTGMGIGGTSMGTSGMGSGMGTMGSGMGTMGSGMPHTHTHTPVSTHTHTSAHTPAHMHTPASTSTHTPASLLSPAAPAPVSVSAPTAYYPHAHAHTHPHAYPPSYVPMYGHNPVVSASASNESGSVSPYTGVHMYPAYVPHMYPQPSPSFGQHPVYNTGYHTGSSINTAGAIGAGTVGTGTAGTGYHTGTGINTAGAIGTGTAGTGINTAVSPGYPQAFEQPAQSSPFTAPHTATIGATHAAPAAVHSGYGHVGSTMGASDIGFPLTAHTAGLPVAPHVLSYSPTQQQLQPPAPTALSHPPAFPVTAQQARPIEVHAALPTSAPSRVSHAPPTQQKSHPAAVADDDDFGTFESAPAVQATALSSGTVPASMAKTLQAALQQLSEPDEFADFVVATGSGAQTGIAMLENALIGDLGAALKASATAIGALPAHTEKPTGSTSNHMKPFASPSHVPDDIFNELIEPPPVDAITSRPIAVQPPPPAHVEAQAFKAQPPSDGLLFPTSAGPVATALPTQSSVPVNLVHNDAPTVAHDFAAVFNEPATAGQPVPITLAKSFRAPSATTASGAPAISVTTPSGSSSAIPLSRSFKAPSAAQPPQQNAAAKLPKQREESDLSVFGLPISVEARPATVTSAINIKPEAKNVPAAPKAPASTRHAEQLVPTFSMKDFLKPRKEKGANKSDIEGVAPFSHADAVALIASLPRPADLQRVQLNDELGVVTAISTLSLTTASLEGVISALQSALTSASLQALSVAARDAGLKRLQATDEVVTQLLIRLDSLPKGKDTAMLRKEEVRRVHALAEAVEVCKAILDSVELESEKDENAFDPFAPTSVAQSGPPIDDDFAPFEAAPLPPAVPSFTTSPISASQLTAPKNVAHAPTMAAPPVVVVAGEDEFMPFEAAPDAARTIAPPTSAAATHQDAPGAVSVPTPAAQAPKATTLASVLEDMFGNLVDERESAIPPPLPAASLGTAVSTAIHVGVHTPAAEADDDDFNDFVAADAGAVHAAIATSKPHVDLPESTPDIIGSLTKPTAAAHSPKNDGLAMGVIAAIHARTATVQDSDEFSPFVGADAPIVAAPHQDMLKPDPVVAVHTPPSLGLEAFAPPVGVGQKPFTLQPPKETFSPVQSHTLGSASQLTAPADALAAFAMTKLPAEVWRGAKDDDGDDEFGAFASGQDALQTAFVFGTNSATDSAIVAESHHSVHASSQPVGASTVEEDAFDEFQASAPVPLPHKPVDILEPAHADSHLSIMHPPAPAVRNPALSVDAAFAMLFESPTPTPKGSTGSDPMTPVHALSSAIEPPSASVAAPHTLVFGLETVSVPAAVRLGNDVRHYIDGTSVPMFDPFRACRAQRALVRSRLQSCYLDCKNVAKEDDDRLEEAVLYKALEAAVKRFGEEDAKVEWSTDADTSFEIADASMRRAGGKAFSRVLTACQLSVEKCMPDALTTLDEVPEDVKASIQTAVCCQRSETPFDSLRRVAASDVATAATATLYALRILLLWKAAQETEGLVRQWQAVLKRTDDILAAMTSGMTALQEQAGDVGGKLYAEVQRNLTSSTRLCDSVKAAVNCTLTVSNIVRSTQELLGDVEQEGVLKIARRISVAVQQLASTQLLNTVAAESEFSSQWQRLKSASKTLASALDSSEEDIVQRIECVINPGAKCIREWIRAPCSVTRKTAPTHELCQPLATLRAALMQSKQEGLTIQAVFANASCLYCLQPVEPGGLHDLCRKVCTAAAPEASWTAALQSKLMLTPAT